MKKLIALITLTSFVAFAQDDTPKDLCLTPKQQLQVDKRIADLEGQNESLKKDAGVAVPTVIAFVVAGLAVGVASTVAVYELSKPK